MDRFPVNLIAFQPMFPDGDAFERHLAAKLRRAMVDPNRDPSPGLIEVDETSMPFRAKHGPVAGGGGPVGRMCISGRLNCPLLRSGFER